MKNLTQNFIKPVVAALALATAFPAHAFTSLYIFGDGITTTTNNTTPYTNYYYGKRYTNGRTWVEVLAQRLGLGANSMTNASWSNSANNWSYYGQYSSNLVANLGHFSQPADASTALFVVWVNNADFVNNMTFYPSTNIVTWTNAINRSLSNHWSIVTNLYYAKGARTFIMPNAVDITEIPQYDGIILSDPAGRNFIRNQVINFNNRFAALLNQARSTLPGITIYAPDYFSLLDNVLTNAGAYGLTNALANGVSTYAMSLPNVAVNGPGTNYVYWDQTDPTAKLHEIMADVALPAIAPVQIAQITALNNGSNRLDVVNAPAGLSGFIEGCTNLASPAWTTLQNISSSATAQSYFVPTPVDSSLNPKVVVAKDGITPPGPGGTVVVTALEFYRLHYSYSWNWP